MAHDSELPHRLPEHEVLVKTGEIWPRVYHEVGLVDRRLGVAVCSAPASFPGDIAEDGGRWSGRPSIEDESPLKESQ